MSNSTNKYARARRARREQRERTLEANAGMIGCWTCCGKEHLAFSLQHARKMLEFHETEHHHGKSTGSFGMKKGDRKEVIGRYGNPPKKIEEPRIEYETLKIAKNGTISLDLSQPDEACLLPPEWGGKYPHTKNSERLRKLSEQQNHRCCYCGKRTWSSHYLETGEWQDMSSIEHVLCRYHGGTNKKGNIVMACSECNNQRARSNPIIFMYERRGLLDWELVPMD